MGFGNGSTISAAAGDIGAGLAGLDEFVGVTKADDLGRRADAHWLKGPLAATVGDTPLERNLRGRAAFGQS